MNGVSRLDPPTPDILPYLLGSGNIYTVSGSIVLLSSTGSNSASILSIPCLVGLKNPPTSRTLLKSLPGVCIAPGLFILSSFDTGI